MEIDTIRIVMTVVSFVTFLAIVAWAIHSANRERFDAASRLPFEEIDER